MLPSCLWSSDTFLCDRGFDMPFLKKLIAIGGMLCLTSGTAMAAKCGNTSAGFEAWKADFAKQAQRSGVGKRGLQALSVARYSQTTINADRNQKSFRYTLAKFMQIRGSATIEAQGRKRLAKNPQFYQALEKRYGVPAGVLLAIHGMETGFGGFMGDTPVVSAITTLAYDCRRSDFFKPHAIGALKLVDQGTITSATLGAKHGELGHTQFLPGNAYKYGVDASGDGRVDLYNLADAMATTANFLRKKGWKRGKGYQEGQPNFRVIKEWNAAAVYQQAIAIMAAKIDG